MQALLERNCHAALNKNSFVRFDSHRPLFGMNYRRFLSERNVYYELLIVYRSVAYVHTSTFHSYTQYLGVKQNMVEKIMLM